ncbi:helix-turn-helix domain-containing protein [Allostreptomyces psammosilenae]|uniref:Transcriptional regulator with XRE-family HTH domain n=1 Tax=Allostreptomyces psammosilenae TaxID=1892865 RepID=A0A852ZS84_9ACTN|nr:helix-turn-helix transcriptional regulator [Allostreptomyces psammosilenae]NYI05243.1 transcriptional regulator with XRE-family HTH domain [Allostreptomyces psammosilenae]
MSHDIERFASWVEGLMRSQGYDIDSPRGGGRAQLAEDSGVHRAAITRMLQRQSLPDLETLRRLAPALGVSVREMLIRTGRVTEEDLPLPAAEPPRRLMSPAEAAVAMGVPPSHRQLFVDFAEMLLRDSGAADSRRRGRVRG